MNRNLMFILTSFLVASFTSCGNQNKGSDSAAISDSIPSYVRNIINAVSDNDSSRFAQLVSYPLSRPYPLHDIEDESQMKAYYATLVDDSLKNKIASSKASDWSENGWRGYTLDDGQYLWTDSLVYDIPYISIAETLKINQLISEELASLWSPLRSGWIPIESIESIDGKMIARIDRQDLKKESGINSPDRYRLAIYHNINSLKDKPSKVYDGSLDYEGSEMNRVYTFTSSDGSKLIYDADVAGNEPPHVILTDSAGNQNMIPVKKVYWLDLLK